MSGADAGYIYISTRWCPHSSSRSVGEHNSNFPMVFVGDTHRTSFHGVYKPRGTTERI
jgi:hypothetical protein